MKELLTQLFGLQVAVTCAWANEPQQMIASAANNHARTN
jgi:hypothetical protein